VRIEFVYALADEQKIQSLELASGATVADALALIDWVARPQDDTESSPTPDWQTAKLGIFGEPCDLTHPLKDGDRIELYRELILDAQTARKRRSEKQTEARKRRSED